MDNAQGRPLYETNALSKSYRPDERANGTGKAHGIRFGPIRIPRGGVIALVGESGTGKTTLFNLLGGLDEPDREGIDESPRILLDLGDWGVGPVDVAATPERFPRERVGFVFQSGFLLRNASAGLNLSLPRAQQGLRTPREDLARRLESLGIPAREIDERAWKFSGGEAQRVAFVRAMAHDPALVFADEPTSNVDYRNAVAIMGQLRDWVHDPANPGRTVLWITHDLRLAAAIADAVLVLHRDCAEPIEPVCLPGDPEQDLDARTAALERWSYSRAAMTAEAPPAFAGHGTVAPPAPPVRPSWLARARVKLGTIRKLGLSEVFSRHSAQRLAAVRGRVNPALSVAGGTRSGGGPLSALGAWARSFGQWPSVAALALIMLLGASGLSILDMVDDHFERSVNDPGTCHLIVKTKRAQTLDRGTVIERLAARPWEPRTEPKGAVAAEPPPLSFEPVAMTPRATCREGDAAYGRRDARGWGIALAEDGVCPAAAQTHVRLLTADEYEPVWTGVGLLASVADTQESRPETVAEYLDGQFAENDSLFLAAWKASELVEGDFRALVGRDVCLIDPTWPGPVPLRVKGIVDEVPSWQQNRFAGYIPNYTYDAFSQRVGLGTHPTDIAVYFASTGVDALEDYLRLENYSFVADNLNKVRRLVESSGVFKGIVTGFLALVGLLLGVLTAMSVQSYLDANAQSFALLKAFGMSWRSVFGILLVEVSVGWLIAALLLAGLIGAVGLASGSGPVQFAGMELATASLWAPYLLAAGGVWLLSALVSLGMTLAWWSRNRYVAQVLKAG